MKMKSSRSNFRLKFFQKIETATSLTSQRVCIWQCCDECCCIASAKPSSKKVFLDFRWDLKLFSFCPKNQRILLQNFSNERSEKTVENSVKWSCIMSMMNAHGMQAAARAAVASAVGSLAGSPSTQETEADKVLCCSHQRASKQTVGCHSGRAKSSAS